MVQSKTNSVSTWAIRTPATTANMGPGYDVIGMALGMYNELQIQRACCSEASSLDIFGEGEERADDPEENLIFVSYKRACEKLGLEVHNLRVKCLNRIPFARGLGSSSAAIVSGVLAAQLIHDFPMSLEDILDLISELDGHPDNVLPCLLGGAVLSARNAEGKLFYERITVHSDIQAYVYIPEIEVKTKEARQTLPDCYPASDVVHNLGHLAILVQALANGNHENLKHAMRDRLHEPYRFPLIPGLEAVADKARSLDHWGVALSGSGPSLLVLGPRDEDFSILVETGKEHGLEGRLLSLQPALSGALCYQDGLEINLWH